MGHTASRNCNRQIHRLPRGKSGGHPLWALKIAWAFKGFPAVTLLQRKTAATKGSEMGEGLQIS